MNEGKTLLNLSLSIAAVERDTGLSKDTLRVWERRYGFPTPNRDGQGERAYSIEQVEKLRIVKRLLDAGHRPGRVVALDIAALQQLSEHIVETPNVRPADPGLCSDAVLRQLAQIRSHDLQGLRRELVRLLARYGLQRFVAEVMAPLNMAVGDAWLRGQLEIFEEHAYTEVAQGLLRSAIAQLPPPRPGEGPRVLLSTFPGEQHSMGLLMAHAVMVLEGCDCISLGVQTPLWDLVLAARAFEAEVVALSFSASLGPNQIVDGLGDLRGKLPAAVALWAGGSAPVLQRRPLHGVRALPDLDALSAELQHWRQGRNPA